VRTVYDVPFGFGVHLALRAEFESEMLANVLARPLQGSRDVYAIVDDGFDAVAAAFHLRLDRRHFVPVEGVIGVSIDVKLSHDGDVQRVLGGVLNRLNNDGGEGNFVEEEIVVFCTFRINKLMLYYADVYYLNLDIKNLICRINYKLIRKYFPRNR